MRKRCTVFLAITSSCDFPNERRAEVVVVSVMSTVTLQSYPNSNKSTGRIRPRQHLSKRNKQ